MIYIGSSPPIVLRQSANRPPLTSVLGEMGHRSRLCSRMPNVPPLKSVVDMARRVGVKKAAVQVGDSRCGWLVSMVGLIVLLQSCMVDLKSKKQRRLSECMVCGLFCRLLPTESAFGQQLQERATGEITSACPSSAVGAPCVRLKKFVDVYAPRQVAWTT